MCVTFDLLLTDVEARLNHLACSGIVDGVHAAGEVGAALRAQAKRLAAARTAVGAELAASFRAIAKDAGSEQDKLTAALNALAQTRRGAAALAIAEPVPATPFEPLDAIDELATLRSDPEMGALFVAEALDHLGTIEAALLALDNRPNDAGLLNDIFRPFHTVKGNAGALGLTSIQDVAHCVESLLDLARAGRHPVRATEVDLVLRAVDVLTAMVTDVGRQLKGQPASALGETARALMDHVDRIIASGGADAVGQPASAAAPEAPSQADDSAAPATLRRFDDVPGHASIKVDTRKLDNLVDAVGELLIVQALIHEDPALATIGDGKLSRSLGQLKRITSELQRGAMALRMVPVRQAFQKVTRVVRDLGKNTGKTLELVVSGEDTELDRKVVEEITDPLMHMVRNSADHGIESVQVRLANGKPARGRISLSAYHQGGNIVLEVADDGGGLQTEKIWRRAVERGLVSASATPSADEIHALIFAPGFSTAETVTEISGRGVGMDVVRRNIEALRGRIEIRSEHGKGTTFFIKLPLTLAVLDGLVAGIGGERIVLPTNIVRESLRPTAAQIHTVTGQPRMVRVRHSLVPLVFLGEVFGMPYQTDPLQATVVVIDDEGRQIGLVVDDLLSKQEVVIKSLGETFSSVRGVAGGAILGDGRIGLILDGHGIVELIRGERRAA